MHSFFSFQNVSNAEKLSRDDPGACFGTFDFTYRLPFLRRWVTLYTDSLVHDDVSPISAPRRSGVRPVECVPAGVGQFTAERNTLGHRQLFQSCHLAIALPGSPLLG